MTAVNNNAVERAVVIGVIELDDVLHDNGHLDAPFNFKTFEEYCRRNYVNESLDFWKAVRDLRAQSGGFESLKMLCSGILSTFVEEGSPLEINISAKQRAATCDRVQAFLKSDEAVKNGAQIIVFNEAIDEVLKLMSTDVWPRFREYASLRQKVGLSREIALWWRNDITLREFFSFPSPINLLESRLNNLSSAILIAISVLLTYVYDFKWLSFYIIYGFTARTLCGPRIDPQAFFTLFVLRPLFEDVLQIGTSSFHPGAPFRFAQTCGLVFSITGTLLHFFDQMLAGYIVWGTFFCAALLAATTGICAACATFKLLCRFGLINEAVAKSVNVKFVNAQQHHHHHTSSAADNDGERY